MLLSDSPFRPHILRSAEVTRSVDTAVYMVLTVIRKAWDNRLQAQNRTDSMMIAAKNCLKI